MPPVTQRNSRHFIHLKGRGGYCPPVPSFGSGTTPTVFVKDSDITIGSSLRDFPASPSISVAYR